MIIQCNASFLQQIFNQPKLRQENHLKIECDNLLKLFQKVDENNDVLIISGFNELENNTLKFFVEKILNRTLFISSREEVAQIEFFKVEPFLEINWKTLSETSRVGGFHTDFWASPIPPRFILLQCLNSDPKHPYYGRNQYVSMDSLYQKIEDIFGIKSSKILRNTEFSYACHKGNTHQFDDGQTARFHEFLANDVQEFDDFSLLSVVRDVALSICEDFVLNKNDLVIFNNHRGLHRRGEASIKFETKDLYQSRHLNTLRFY
jgi:alpha-ketoglutarate-dependent taurine dioxygenase